MKYSKLLLLCCLLFGLQSFGQDDMVTSTPEEESIKPLRIGVRIGSPNILTLNAEYVTPLLDDRVAATMDFMSLSKTIDDTSIKYSNFEIGTNVYMNPTGKGLYAGLTYFSFNGEGDFTEVEFDSGVYDGTGTIKFSTINLKIGAKIGRKFYFRVEAGFGFGGLPSEITIKSDETGEVTIDDIPNIPGIGVSGIPVFNIGFGFGFL